MKLELRQVAKKIRGVWILKDINLTLESGRIYGLWGKNGCGKTMLMRLMSGLILPTEGQVLLDGRELGKELDFPESVGLLLENPAFLNGYTGLENLRALAEIKGLVGEEEIRRTLAQVGLDPDDTRKYRKYSLGMKQRLGIACAVMEKPELILLDEPVNAIDEKGVVTIREMLLSLKEENRLIVLACHDREELELLADEIITMGEGCINGRRTVGEEAEDEEDGKEEGI